MKFTPWIQIGLLTRFYSNSEYLHDVATRAPVNVFLLIRGFVGPLEYFDAIQAMRPPYFFPSSDEGPAFVKFFAENRYPVNDPSRLKKTMTK